MLKKIFCVALMMAAIIFVGNAKVFAQDVWLHTDSNGTKYYVMTETLKNLTPHRGVLIFEGDVKYVENHSLFDQKKVRIRMGEAGGEYSFDGSRGALTFKNKYTVEIVALAFYRYCYKHFNIEPNYFRMAE